MPGLSIGKTLQVLKLTEFATVLKRRSKGKVSEKTMKRCLSRHFHLWPQPFYHHNGR